MTNGFHSHYCPRCREQKDCAQITHCRKAPNALCADCVYDDYTAKQKGKNEAMNTPAGSTDSMICIGCGWSGQRSDLVTSACPRCGEDRIALAFPQEQQAVTGERVIVWTTCPHCQEVDSWDDHYKLCRNIDCPTLTQEIQDEWENGEDFDAGWYETSVENNEPPNCWAITPSHWQPMPTPPSASRPETRTALGGTKDLEDQATQLMDAVVDAAVEWHQSDSGDEFAVTTEALSAAVDALLALRGPITETALGADSEQEPSVYASLGYFDLNEIAGRRGYSLAHLPYVQTPEARQELIDWLTAYDNRLQLPAPTSQPETKTALRGNDLADTDVSSCPHLHQTFPGTEINKCLDCVALADTIDGRASTPCVCQRLPHTNWCPREGMDSGSPDSHPLTCGRWFQYDENHKRYVPDAVCTCGASPALAVSESSSNHDSCHSQIKSKSSVIQALVNATGQETFGAALLWINQRAVSESSDSATSDIDDLWLLANKIAVAIYTKESYLKSVQKTPVVCIGEMARVIEGELRKLTGSTASAPDSSARQLLADLLRRGFLDDEIFENPNFDDAHVVSLVAAKISSGFVRGLEAAAKIADKYAEANKSHAIVPLEIASGIRALIPPTEPKETK